MRTVFSDLNFNPQLRWGIDDTDELSSIDIWDICCIKYINKIKVI